MPYSSCSVFEPAVPDCLIFGVACVVAFLVCTAAGLLSSNPVDCTSVAVTLLVF